MGFFYSLFSLAAGCLASLLLLRAYVWSLAITPRDPLVRFLWTMTDWFVGPVSYLVKPRGAWDFSSLFAALLVALVQTLVMREVTGFPVSATMFVITPIALIVRWSLDLLIWAVILYVILSFMSMRFSGYRALLGVLVDPVLRPFRRIVPSIKGYDLSPILLFLVLNLLMRFIVPLSMGFEVF